MSVITHNRIPETLVLIIPLYTDYFNTTLKTIKRQQAQLEHKQHCLAEVPSRKVANQYQL